MNEEQIIQVIHQAICEDSLEDCRKYWGDCVRAGTQLYPLIKGENKASHTHEIEVFGAPCDCGTRHEYCGECSWVEPCEPEGEQK